tara:strand:- start:785 stop:1420 length:636 start_codon:yes stop_codon:yes gene_type:complete
MSLTHTHAKQVRDLEQKVADLEKAAGAAHLRQCSLTHTLVTRQGKKQEHYERLIKNWITMRIKNEVEELVGDEFEMKFNRSDIHVECQTEFDTGDVVGGSIGGREDYICPGEVIPDFVEYLIICEREGEDNEDYFFQVDGFGEWYVKGVRLSGAARDIGGKPSLIKWMKMAVKFEHVKKHECCISGEEYREYEMVTNGDDWMFRGVWEAFE